MITRFVITTVVEQGGGVRLHLRGEAGTNTAGSGLRLGVIVPEWTLRAQVGRERTHRHSTRPCTAVFIQRTAPCLSRSRARSPLVAPAGDSTNGAIPEEVTYQL